MALQSLVVVMADVEQHPRSSRVTTVLNDSGFVTYRVGKLCIWLVSDLGDGKPINKEKRETDFWYAIKFKSSDFVTNAKKKIQNSREGNLNLLKRKRFKLKVSN